MGLVNLLELGEHFLQLLVVAPDDILEIVKVVLFHEDIVVWLQVELLVII